MSDDTKTGTGSAGNADQLAQQAAQQIGQQVADQVARSISQAVREAAAESSRQVLDASRTAASQEVGAERESETGMDDAFKALSTLAAQATLLNLKRTVEEYQHESLESIRRNRTHVDTIVTDARAHESARQAIATQALQNAVETANMVGKNAVSHQDAMNKQHTAHRDIATDNLWNPVQQGAGDTLTARAVSIDDASLKAIGAMVAAAVASALAPRPQA